VSTRVIVHTSRINKSNYSTPLCRMWHYGCMDVTDYSLDDHCVCAGEWWSPWRHALRFKIFVVGGRETILHWSITGLRAGYGWIQYCTVDNLLYRIAEWDYAGQSYCIQPYYVTGLEAFAAALYRKAFPCVTSCGNGDGPTIRILALLQSLGVDGKDEDSLHNADYQFHLYIPTHQKHCI
jgi:hypothetical protein